MNEQVRWPGVKCVKRTEHCILCALYKNSPLLLRRRRWTNIKTTSFIRVVFAGIAYVFVLRKQVNPCIMGIPTFIVNDVSLIDV